MAQTCPNKALIFSYYFPIIRLHSESILLIRGSLTARRIGNRILGRQIRADGMFGGSVTNWQEDCPITWPLMAINPPAWPLLAKGTKATGLGLISFLIISGRALIYKAMLLSVFRVQIGL